MVLIFIHNVGLALFAFVSFCITSFAIEFTRRLSDRDRQNLQTDFIEEFYLVGALTIFASVLYFWR